MTVVICLGAAIIALLMAALVWASFHAQKVIGEKEAENQALRITNALLTKQAKVVVPFNPDERAERLSKYTE